MRVLHGAPLGVADDAGDDEDRAPFGALQQPGLFGVGGADADGLFGGLQPEAVAALQQPVERAGEVLAVEVGGEALRDERLLDADRLAVGQAQAVEAPGVLVAAPIITVLLVLEWS